jgi:hypothetical protein
VIHGFLRTAAGVITPFDATGAGTGPGQGTQVESMNASGAITGWYIDNTGVYHAFERKANGTFVEFTVAGAIATYGIAANSAGTICGFYINLDGQLEGFVRSASGTITGYEPPGAGTGVGQGAMTYGINNGGTIVGPFTDSAGVYAGYIRTP